MVRYFERHSWYQTSWDNPWAHGLTQNRWWSKTLRSSIDGTKAMYVGSLLDTCTRRVDSSVFLHQGPTGSLPESSQDLTWTLPNIYQNLTGISNESGHIHRRKQQSSNASNLWIVNMMMVSLWLVSSRHHEVNPNRKKYYFRFASRTSRTRTFHRHWKISTIPTSLHDLHYDLYIPMK